jgi:hypothetical protein
VLLRAAAQYLIGHSALLRLRAIACRHGERSVTRHRFRSLSVRKEWLWRRDPDAESKLNHPLQSRAGSGFIHPID